MPWEKKRKEKKEMNSWLFALQLIPLIMNLMTTIEKIMGPGTGVQKKEFVKDGVRQVVKEMSAVSTGGQKQTWETVDLFMEPISRLIDVLSGLLFPNEEVKEG